MNKFFDDYLNVKKSLQVKKNIKHKWHESMRCQMITNLFSKNPKPYVEICNW